MSEASMTDLGFLDIVILQSHSDWSSGSLLSSSLFLDMPSLSLTAETDEPLAENLPDLNRCCESSQRCSRCECEA